VEEKKKSFDRKTMRHRQQTNKAKRVFAFLFVFLCAILAVAFLPGLRSALEGNPATLKSKLVLVEKPRIAPELNSRASVKQTAHAATTSIDEGIEELGFLATDTSYKSAHVAVDIQKVTKGGNTYYVAHVKLKDPSLLKTGTYTNELGKVVKADVVKTGIQNNAVIAINTDFYTYRDSGNIIRNGQVILNQGWGDTLCIYADGSMDVVNGLRTDTYDLQAKGVVNAFSFGPALVKDGQVLTENVTGSIIRDAKHPRTGIGYYGPGDYLFICLDGRKQGYSVGMTIAEFAELFHSYGVEMAYNFDGGGSTTMSFMGKLVNLPQGNDKHLRGVDGILFVSDNVYP